ncbi:MAG: dihydroneopterin aldolase [Aquisalimonadaceae bacterium]
MDIVTISELQVDAIIGVHAWERRVRQKVILNLELGTESGPAAASDAIEDALDYSAVTASVTRLVVEADCRLLETLAERVAAHLVQDYGVPWLRLELRKPGAVSNARYVGVIIERGSRG